MENLDLKDLIKILTELEKKGITTLQLKGTLMSIKDGNTIIATTEKQI